MEPPAPSQPALPADSILIKTLTKTQLFAIRRAQEDHNAAGARFQQSGTVLREILVDCGLDLARDAANAVLVGGAGAREELRAQGERYLAQFQRDLRAFGSASRVRTGRLYAPASQEPDQSTVTFEP